MGQPGFFYENGCSSGTESRKMAPKVGNEQSLRGLQKGRCNWGHTAKIGFFWQKNEILGPKKALTSKF